MTSEVEDPESWRDLLRDADARIRARRDATRDRDEVRTFERRVDELNAEVTALRAAVTLRERLLREQDVALRERTRALEEALRERDAALDPPLGTLARRTAGAAKRRAVAIVRDGRTS